MKKKYFYLLFRFIFGISIICLGINIMLNQNSENNYIENTLGKLNSNYNVNLNKYNDYISYFHIFLFISSGLLINFGFILGKINLVFALLIQILLVKNPLIIKDNHLENLANIGLLFAGISF